MTDSRRSRRAFQIEQRRRTFTRARALLIGALVLGVGATATVAAWTDNEYAATEITAGTFSIVSRTDASPAFAAHDAPENAATLPLNATGLYPGQSRAAWIQLTTVGTVPGSVQLSAVTAPVNDARGTALANALDVRIVATTDIPGSTPTCATDTPGGTTYTGIGNLPIDIPAQPLEAEGANVANYCVIVTLRADAASDAQGGIVTPTWTFTGTSG